ncbi:MAG: DUF4375 domain-containing protein [Pyrinomonadaceae bacterium]|nr:DUF4375 domain-containing protein [Sphingobacteriaceae bacterium]
MKHSKLLYILMFSSILNLFSCSVKTANKKNIDSSDIMREFIQNIESNRTLTKQILDTTADEQLENKIIANINSKQNSDLSNDKDVLPSLSKERQAIYFIYLVEMEVNNGGFHQFYLNHFVINDSSYMLDKTTEAFQVIGATKFTDLVKRTNRIFKMNEKDFANTGEIFEKLDQEFYDTYKHENLYELRIKFIRNNLEGFVDK